MGVLKRYTTLVKRARRMILPVVSVPVKCDNNKRGLFQPAEFDWSPTCQQGDGTVEKATMAQDFTSCLTLEYGYCDV